MPRRDLWISPNHAMYLDGLLIEAKDLVNGVSIVQADRVEKVEYFHVELETHDVIIAEGALSETSSTMTVANVPQCTRIRGDVSRCGADLAHYCAPRVDEGYELEAIRRRIALRAGLTSNSEVIRIGKLRGYVDLVSVNCVEGWAQNIDHPEAPVCLDIYAGGRLIGRTLANRYRADREHSGMGSGHHSFAFTAPDGLTFPDAVEVRRSLDGTALSWSAHARKRLQPSIAA